MKYLAYNTYASISSNGFPNTWAVLAFESESDANAAFSTLDDSHKRPVMIKKREIKSYIEAAKPFSGKSRRIISTGREDFFTGCVGEVQVDWSTCGMDVE